MDSAPVSEAGDVGSIPAGSTILHPVSAGNSRWSAAIQEPELLPCELGDAP